jgi:hypothetical protein
VFWLRRAFPGALGQKSDTPTCSEPIRRWAQELKAPQRPFDWCLAYCFG